jgi:hypothetical protein
MSMLFMEVGRSSPRYQEMALLYPRSQDLQSYISEYFIVAVHLCQRIISFSVKSTMSRIVSALSDPELKAFRSELNLWAKSIKDEANLLLAKKVHEEAQEGFRFRALSTRFSKTAEHQQKLATKLQILDLFSTYDFETTWKQIRKVGNTRIFAQTDDYQRWKTGSGSHALVYTGKLGCGKSVMLANIVEDLVSDVASTDATVAYFFCRHNVLQSLTERTIIGALARQILRSVSHFSSLSYPDKSHLSSLEIIHLVDEALLPDTKVYVILDGLHLCDLSSRRDTIAAIHKLQVVRKINLCVSHRLEPNSTIDIPNVLHTSIIP